MIGKLSIVALAAVALGGCVSDSGYRSGVGDYYYGRPGIGDDGYYYDDSGYRGPYDRYRYGYPGDGGCRGCYGLPPYGYYGGYYGGGYPPYYPPYYWHRPPHRPPPTTLPPPGGQAPPLGGRLPPTELRGNPSSGGAMPYSERRPRPDTGPVWRGESGRRVPPGMSRPMPAYPQARIGDGDGRRQSPSMSQPMPAQSRDGGDRSERPMPGVQPRGEPSPRPRAEPATRPGAVPTLREREPRREGER